MMMEDGKRWNKVETETREILSAEQKVKLVKKISKGWTNYIRY